MIMQGTNSPSVHGLAAFPRDLREQVLALLKPINFASGQILQHPGSTNRYCYFLNTGLVTLSLPERQGQMIEVGLTGPGGFVGAPSLLTNRPSPHTVHARSRVQAWQAPSNALRDIMATSDCLRKIITAYLSATLDQALELVACTARHSVEQRLARWIFVASRQVGDGLLCVTHDALGEHLCVRRASITTALHRLEGERAIYATRGTIRIRDVKVLQRCSCGCHRMVQLGASSDVPSAGGGDDLWSIPLSSGADRPGLARQPVSGAEAFAMPVAPKVESRNREPHTPAAFR